MYEGKDLYIVNFKNVEHYFDMHEAIEKGLSFPAYYGQNWDAFWDCMTDFCCNSLNIEFRNADVIKEKFPTAYDKLLKILSDYKSECADEFPEGLSIKIQDGDNEFYI